MIRLVLLLLLVGLILAIRYLPWWALLGGPVLLIVLFWLLRGRIFWWLLGRLFMLPFKAKGRVLRKASIEVHALRPVANPEQERMKLLEAQAASENGEEEEGEPPPPPDIPRLYYELEVTITPRAPSGSFKHWEPGELLLVKPGKRWDEDDDSCKVARLEIDDGGTFQEDEGMKYFGPQRLRMIIGVKPGVAVLTFAYYFEQFGEVKLPVAEIP